MAYPDATPDQIDFFQQHGYLLVTSAIPPADLAPLEFWCDRLLENKEELANDWAWDQNEARDKRSFRIVQASPSKLWADIDRQRYRTWLADFSAQLMGQPMEFWYDQFLGKPPKNSVPTYWHQDEGYWGRNLEDRGITGWIPLHAVDEVNGCMHFIDRGHADGILPHHLVPGVQSDLLTCEVDERRAVSCPMARGDVVFHHSKTPHMSGTNDGPHWRKAVTNHLRVAGTAGEGDHYPWRVKVNQRTGERKAVGM